MDDERKVSYEVRREGFGSRLKSLLGLHKGHRDYISGAGYYRTNASCLPDIGDVVYTCFPGLSKRADIRKFEVARIDERGYIEEKEGKSHRIPIVFLRIAGEEADFMQR